jgi:hypothetical protein
MRDVNYKPKTEDMDRVFHVLDFIPSPQSPTLDILSKYM